MIMDDNETLLEGITAFLSKKGCIVDAARNGDEAIALYKKRHKSEEPYDLLIIDVTISGGMGGIAAIKQLKEIDPKVMAIVSSGYSEIPVMSNFRQYGFVAALPKPYTLEELIYVLNKSLESR
jgi:CheY-like chemotaxis protein